MATCQDEIEILEDDIKQLKLIITEKLSDTK